MADQVDVKQGIRVILSKIDDAFATRSKVIH